MPTFPHLLNLPTITAPVVGIEPYVLAVIAQLEIEQCAIRQQNIDVVAVPRLVLIVTATAFVVVADDRDGLCTLDDMHQLGVALLPHD